MKQTGMMLNEIEIKKVIDNMGSNPGALKALGIHMQKGLSLDTFITMTLRLAMDERSSISRS